jgi:hypothetical protein
VSSGTAPARAISHTDILARRCWYSRPCRSLRYFTSTWTDWPGMRISRRRRGPGPVALQGYPGHSVGLQDAVNRRRGDVHLVVPGQEVAQADGPVFVLPDRVWVAPT